MVTMHGTFPIVVPNCLSVNGSFTSDGTIHIVCLILLERSEFFLHSDSDDKPCLIFCVLLFVRDKLVVTKMYFINKMYLRSSYF